MKRGEESGGEWRRGKEREGVGRNRFGIGGQRYGLGFGGIGREGKWIGSRKELRRPGHCTD